jgi:hypothetical protein
VCWAELVQRHLGHGSHVRELAGGPHALLITLSHFEKEIAMSDPIGLSSGLKPVPLPSERLKLCVGCSAVKPWRAYSRRLDKALCEPCWDAGLRLFEKEG